MKKDVQWLSFPSPRSSAPEPVRYVGRSGDMRHTEYGPLAFGISGLCQRKTRNEHKNVLSTKNANTTKRFPSVLCFLLAILNSPMLRLNLR